MGVLIRGRNDTAPARERLGSLEAGRGIENLCRLGKKFGPADTLIVDFQSLELPENDSVVIHHTTCGTWALAVLGSTPLSKYWFSSQVVDRPFAQVFLPHQMQLSLRKGRLWLEQAHELKIPRVQAGERRLFIWPLP